jgi:release factor glutamine methyltransferase
MKALDKLREISKALIPCGIDAAAKEAELLVTHGLNMKTAEMYRDNPEISDEQEKRLKELCMRRMAREPLPYVLGYVEFLHLYLKVGKGVLIPRPETELMAEHAIKMLKIRNLPAGRQGQKSGTCLPVGKVRNKENSSRTTDDGQRISVLDLCTGSGCLALALAREFPDADVLGIDISRASIDIAKDNALINGIENVAFLVGDLFEPLKRKMPVPMYDFIISNPPYIKTDDVSNLQPEISRWEPVAALDGGKDGLDFYRCIIPLSPNFLKRNGTVILELGDGQSDAVTDMFKESGFKEVRTMNDMAGIKRIVQARWTR